MSLLGCERVQSIRCHAEVVLTQRVLISLSLLYLFYAVPDDLQPALSTFAGLLKPRERRLEFGRLL